LGNKDHPLDKAASEWLYIWPLTTLRACRSGGCKIRPARLTESKFINKR